MNSNPSGTNLSQKKYETKPIPKIYPDCAAEALKLIKLNSSRVTRLELSNIANEYVFFNDYKGDQWTKKTNAMQELQCVDCIVTFLEGEADTNTRDLMFDLLFTNTMSQSSTTQVQASIKQTLQLLASYAISLEASRTLESLAKWLSLNIGNEFTQVLINKLLKDHFLLIHTSRTCLNLVQSCPVFSSLFMTIVLDMLANDTLILHESQDKMIEKLVVLFENWLQRNLTLPLLAYRLNQTHSSSYMFNPVPSLFHLICVYPLKSTQAMIDDRLITSLHLATIKLIQTVALKNGLFEDTGKIGCLISLNSVEMVLKRINEAATSSKQLISAHQENLALNRLAQLLIIAFRAPFLINFTPQQFREVFSRYVNRPVDSINTQQQQQEPSAFLKILLSIN
jgi:hypothetical protein